MFGAADCVKYMFGTYAPIVGIRSDGTRDAATAASRFNILDDPRDEGDEREKLG